MWSLILLPPVLWILCFGCEEVIELKGISFHFGSFVWKLPSFYDGKVLEVLHKKAAENQERGLWLAAKACSPRFLGEAEERIPEQNNFPLPPLFLKNSFTFFFLTNGPRDRVPREQGGGEARSQPHNPSYLFPLYIYNLYTRTGAGVGGG